MSGITDWTPAYGVLLGVAAMFAPVIVWVVEWRGR